MAQHKGKQLPTDAPKEELNVARIFRRVYKEVYQFIASQHNTLKDIFKGSLLVDRTELADAYCRIGLNEHAIDHFDKLSEAAISSVPELPAGKFASLLHVLNDIGIFVKD